MNQLLDLQKASIQKGVVFSSESQKNLQDVTAMYLDYQKQFQNLNGAITKDNLEAQHLQKRARVINSKLTGENELANKEYYSLQTKHNWAMAGLQLLALIPLLLLTAFLYKRYGKGPYKSMIIAAGIAVFVKISMVMHEYFPSYLFKYILILALIYITAKLLISKLRMMAKPNQPWLEKQYSEAYQKNHCPICQFPIKPSVSKFFITDNKNNSPIPDYHYLDTVNEYTCPCCGKLLFNKCSKCSHLRYSLLTHCDSCGEEKPVPL